MNTALSRKALAFLIAISVSGIVGLASWEGPTNFATVNERERRPAKGWRSKYLDFLGCFEGRRNIGEKPLVPLAGIEPALLAELDFERPQMPYPLCIRGYPFSR